MESDEFQKEKHNLEEILKKYKDIMEYYDLRLDAIPRIYKDNPIMMENSFKMYVGKLRIMQKNVNKPYFARIDFARDGEEKTEKLYIGKVGVIDEENNNITIDWRAPISSMYYDSNLGRASYEAPEGVCKGELLLKRQYDIEDGILKSFQDVDTVSNDELLKPYLNASADNRLKNIVSTIQQEQNAIIREPINKNIIIQGVAGSGKTTVALHRIAYLVYNNRDTIKPNQYLVIGPNKFFVNYISGVLPDLDVENVKQLTYEELCAECLNENIKLIDEDKKLITYISNENLLNYEKFKVSMRFKEAIDKFILELDKNIIPEKDIEIKDYIVIPENIIKNIYNSIQNSTIYETIKSKLDRTNIELCKYVEENYDDIMEKEVKSICKTSLKKYFDRLIPNVINTYIKFLTNLKRYINFEQFENIEPKVQNNIKNIKQRKVEFEDLSALIYLKCKLLGIEEYREYRQVAIDEAQDFGDFNFFALKTLLKNATFSIFGDLAQSIYQYRGIDNWNEVKDISFNDKCEIKYLLKSYRTTTEIMNSANNITNYINLNTAKPVIRHGNLVKYINYNNEDDQIGNIENILEKYKENGYKTIAIICKDEAEAININKKLYDKDIVVNNITNSDTQYNGGVCTITSYLAKGLEFDGVVIANASEEKYNSDKDIDMKLLYVAMTRPLHELNVLYKDNIVKPLEVEIK